MSKSKDDVLAMLAAYRDDLNNALAVSNCMGEVDAAAHAARRTNKIGKAGNIPWENTLVGRVLVPALNRTLCRIHGIKPSQARAMILSENVASRREFASPYRAARATKHPFGKIAKGTAKTVEAWWPKDGKPNGLAPACPDFALGAPYRVVFEAKYYRAASQSAELARRTLVKEIYQAFYYRALPFAASNTKGGPPWSYEYAVFVAVDASPGNVLATEWASLSKQVRSSFWGSGNIDVIILPTPSKTT